MHENKNYFLILLLRYKYFKGPRNIISARFCVKLDSAHYKYNWNSFKFWKSDHRRLSSGQICNVYLVVKKWTLVKSDLAISISVNKKNGLAFFSTYLCRGYIETSMYNLAPLWSSPLLGFLVGYSKFQNGFIERFQV